MLLYSVFDTFSDYYHKSPELVIFFVLLFSGVGLIVYSNAHKVSAGGIDLPASKSKDSNLRKKIAFWFGISIVTSGILVLIGFIPISVKSPDARDNLSNNPPVKMRQEIGGYGGLPIIRIQRNCFARATHEYENYTLFAGNFRNEIDAMNRVSTLDAYNIRNVGYFVKQCDSIPMISGTYFVFLGRRCSSLKSIQRYETKYETMLRTNDSIDLKIIKWEKSDPVYTTKIK